jgi:hypothetical protein
MVLSCWQPALRLFVNKRKEWSAIDLQLVYMSFLLTALLLFSWSTLRTGLLAPWIGRTALAWSLLSFPLYFLLTGAPLIVIVTSLLFDVGLLLRG